MGRCYLVACLFACLWAQAGDWPTLGEGPSRNMVNTKEKSLPDDWDANSKTGVKWVAELGSQSYGNPVIAGGKVFVGTNNDGKRDPKVTEDKGVVMVFRESDGAFLWQAIHDKLPSGHANDWPQQGVASTPFVDGNRVFYVSNRCELICADTEGFTDGKNDGPFTSETYNGPKHADIIWSFDMIKELKVYPHNLANSSPLVVGDSVFVLTSNGVDKDHQKVPSPESPSLISVNKKTGKLNWAFKDTGTILHGQWSSPAYGVMGGKKQVVFGAGDGVVYSLNPDTGELIWKYDCNPKESKYQPGGYGDRNSIIATPVIYDNKVYLATGQDPEHGAGKGSLHAIDGTGTGDVTASKRVWALTGDDFGRTMSTVSISQGRLYVSDLEGFFYCIDAKSGKVLWKHDLFATVWGSSMVADGKVYIGDEDGDVCILKDGPQLEEIAEMNMGNSIYTTPSAANGVLYLVTRNKLFALKK